MTTTLINVFPPNAFVVRSSNGAAYDLLAVNVVTGVVTSALLPASATSYLTLRMQYLLSVLPGLSTTALKALIRNLLLLDQLEGTVTATVTDVGDVYSLGLSGLASPSNLQVTIPFSTSSPFATGAGTGGGGGGSLTMGPVGSSPNANAGTITAGVLALELASTSFPGLISAIDRGNLDQLAAAYLPVTFPNLTTENDTPVQQILAEISTNQCWMVEVQLFAADVGFLGDGQCASFDLVGTFKNLNGVLTQVSATTVLWTQKDDAAWDAVFSINGTNLCVTVTGDAIFEVGWYIASRVRMTSFITPA